MPNYEDWQEVNKLLKEAQDAEHDNREKVREVTHFLEKPDGQWEPSVAQNMTNRPKYTFDLCNPVVDSIAGELEQAEFSIKCRPANGEATKDAGKIFDGLIRNIQAISDADQVFDASGRQMVAAGFDAWRVVHDWADDNSFEQDLLIKKIGNATDRVWFDTNSEEQDASDAEWCFVLQSITPQRYEELWPEGSKLSVGDDNSVEVYSYKPDQIVVGEFLYKERVNREIILMSNNAVYEDDEEYQKVKDDLEANGITEVRRRKRKKVIVKSRMFDGKDWLENAKETVFSLLPIIPTYANFKISENKVIYRGAVEKLMDAQRVYNYAQSRSIEEGALAPRGKYWMTRDQAAKDKDSLRTMNTNADPVQLYTHVPDQPPPFWQGGAQINQGLQLTAQSMENNIIKSSGIFAANQGDAPNQSGYAIELQQQKGDNSTIKYFQSQEIAIRHTGRILVDAIPRVYDTKRTVRILAEDGTSTMETINTQVFDNESQQMVEINDLRKGKYDVVCDVGPAFRSRQQETARSFLEAAGVDPTLIEMGGDIWLKNLTAPGFDQMAERKRQALLKAGLIPDTQMTDEEKEQVQQLIRQKQIEIATQKPDPLEVAMLEQTQANTADIVSKARERTDKTGIAERKQDFEEAKFAEQLDQQAMKSFMEQQKAFMERITSMVNNMNTQADSLKKLKEAIGADAIVGPDNVEAYKNQAEIIVDSQEALESEIEGFDERGEPMLRGGFDENGNRIQ